MILHGIQVIISETHDPILTNKFKVSVVDIVLILYMLSHFVTAMLHISFDLLLWLQMMYLKV